MIPGLMAQTFPTSAQVIYDTLTADAQFMSLLGEYDFKANSSPIPAIAVVTAGEDLPALRNVSGVECVIQDAGDTTMRSYLTSSPTSKTRWSVFLVSWEPSRGSDLQAAADRITQRFVGASSVQTVATTDGLGSLVQTKVEIMSDMPIIPAA